MPHPDFPPQPQLLLPLLEALAERGGTAPSRAAADAVAAKVNLPAAARQHTVNAGAAGQINAWDRHVRWTRQQGVLRGLIAGPARAQWTLTDHGHEVVNHARPGIVVTVYETERGVALWGECESAVRHLSDGLVTLIVTSPPYPLLRHKAYGNRSGEDYLEWLLACAQQWKPALSDDGSLVLNLGDVWEPGQPTLSTYQERLILGLTRELGYHLAQRFAWENPSKMPAPAEWVTIRRVRATPSLESIYWLSKGPHPKADNRRVLHPYSARMRSLLAQGGDQRQTRPSGHDRVDGAFSQDNGGSIPHNLLVLPNTASNDAYTRGCKATNLPVHPARFPAGLPEFFIRFLTEEDDVVWDPFGGSGMTAEVCERLQRRWLLSETSLAYLRGAALRVQHAPGFTSYLPTAA